MGKRNLNKKSLFYMQEGGENSQTAGATLAQQIGALMQSGVPPQVIIQQLIGQGLDEADIREAFMDLGISSSELDELFKSEEEIQEELDEELDAVAEEAQQGTSESDEDYDDIGDSDVKFGVFGADLPEARTGFESVFPSTVNQYFGIRRQEGDSYVRNPMMDYLPMDLGTRGDILGAGFALAEGITNLFGGKTDPTTGLKEGFFRDVDVKKARQKAAIPSYYDYKVTTAAGDKNTYVGDPRDLYNAAKNEGQLRTLEEFNKGVKESSLLDYNKDTGRYEGAFSSRPIDPSSPIYTKEQRQKLESLIEKGTPLKDFESRFDPETLNMLRTSVREKQGSLGISPTGESKSYEDAASNPYLYETMMGLNTLKSKPNVVANPPSLGFQPNAIPFKRFKEPNLTDWLNSGGVYPILPVPQYTPVRPPEARKFSGPQPKVKTIVEWMNEDPANRKDKPNSQEQYDAYLKSQGYLYKYGGQSGDILPFLAYGGDLVLAQVGTETQPLSYDEWLGATGRGMIGQELQDSKDYQAYVSSFQAPVSSTVPNTTAPTATKPAAPQVEITNNLEGGFNRLMDSRFMQGYGNLSKLAVEGARFANEIFQNKKAREAEGRLYEMTQADNMFGYYEDPVNKQGTWDVNTGLAEQDNRVEYMRQGQYGGEMMYEEIQDELDLDPDTIAQLIAAGANIQIL